MMSSPQPHKARTHLKLSVLLAAFMLVGAFAATSAQAKIYFGGNGQYIQSAPVGGGKAKNVFNMGQNGIASLAAGGRYLYFSYNSGVTNVGPINRTTLSGKGLRKNIVRGANVVNGLAATGKYIYFGSDDSVGIARLDGSGAKLNFIANAGVVVSVAVDAKYVYWTNVDGTSIGRANLNGSSANPNFISAIPGGVSDVAVSRNSIFWSNSGGTAIGRASSNGSGVNPNFITGMAQVGEVEVHGGYVYWTDAGGQIGPCNGPGCIPSSPGRTAGSIDRAKLNGTGMKRIVKRLNNPSTLAILGD